jgi:nucleoside-diphosphate-sugar epimerase
MHRSLKRRLLITGGAGFLGSHLVDRLIRRSDLEELILVDNLWTGALENLGHVRDDRVKVVVASVEDFTSDTPFDEIIHLSSPASPLWYGQEPERTISANILGAMRLLTMLKKGGRICYTSSSEVYGDPLLSPQPERYRGSVDCTGPRSSYDESKRCTEALLFESKRVRGTDIRVARLFNVYGPRTRKDDGRAVSNFVSAALAGKPITVFGHGTQTRSWGFVDDIINGLERFFWQDEIDYAGPLNIGNDREVPVLDIARYVSSLVPGSHIVHAEPVPQDPTNRRPDLALVQSILPGWCCQIQYEEGIERTLRWFKDRWNGG